MGEGLPAPHRPLPSAAAGGRRLTRSGLRLAHALFELAHSLLQLAQTLAEGYLILHQVTNGLFGGQLAFGPQRQQLGERIGGHRGSVLSFGSLGDWGLETRDCRLVSSLSSPVSKCFACCGGQQNSRLQRSVAGRLFI